MDASPERTAEGIALPHRTDAPIPGQPLGRRKFLGWSLTAAAAAGITSLAGDGDVLQARPVALALGGPGRVLTRPQDQLVLVWEPVNLRLIKAGETGPGEASVARLVVADPAKPAMLIFHFPAQNVAERAYLLVDPGLPGAGGDESAVITTPVPAELANESRLAFVVPATAVIPYTTDGLLAWGGLTPSVVPAAARALIGRPGPQQPSTTQTAIEAPWGLVLSPDDGAGWAHSAAPVTVAGRTELWHTRLGENVSNPTVRAVWTPGFAAGTVPPAADLGPNPPDRTSLTPRQRYEIVRLSADHSLNVQSSSTGAVVPYQPRPIAVNRLMLSTFGAWVDTDGSWDAPVKPVDLDYYFTVEQWLHRATMGRDHYVKVVEAGFLLPFGHRASLVTVTERQFQPVPGQQSWRMTAVNRQRMFVVVREPERSYADTHVQPYGGRAQPWRTVRITTVATPNLAAMSGAHPEPASVVTNPQGSAYGKNAFWPVVPTAAGTQDIQFALEAVDGQGNVTRFTAPLMFVSGNVSDSAESMTQIIGQYRATASARRTRPVGGARVRLTSLDGDSTYPVDAVTLDAELPSPPQAPLDIRRQPRFFPTLAGAAVRLDAAQEITGQAATPNAIPISWHPGYLAGLANPGRIFAKLGSALALPFPGDAIGALATPDLTITGLSALTGLTGGDLNLPLPGAFDPAAFFAAASPKLLGAIPLTEVISAVGFDLPDHLPKLAKVQLPDAVEVSYTWRPAVQHDKLTIFEPHDPNGFTLRATATVRHGAAPDVHVEGELTDFTINALGKGGALYLLAITFNRLRFSADNGMKATVDVDVRGVEFFGPLSFINPLQRFLAKLGLVPGPSAPSALRAAAADDHPPANGPDISVTAAGIRAGYSLSLPPVPAGVFLLENVGFSAVLNIPFLGDPARVRFAFAERERPFLLTVAIFGGGGFCALQLGLDGFERFEAALEFGAKLALDFGVASGGVSAMAGLYLALAKDGATLTGYVRLNGYLRVLGLISLSLEFYLAMTWEQSSGEVWGQARLTVSVDIAFFSQSVTLGPLEKRFAGGSAHSALKSASARAIAAAPSTAPPRVEDLLSATDWSDGYCPTFAPAAFA